MSSTHHARRRTLRTAAVAGAVLAGIAFPIGAAVAQSPAAAPALPATAGTDTGTDSGTGAGDEAGHPGGDWRPGNTGGGTTDVDNGGRPGGDWRPGGGGGTTDVDNSQGRARRVAAGSKQLPGGYVAHLYKNVRNGKVTDWEAEIHRVKGGGLATTLKTAGSTVSAKADGRTFTLTPSGQVTGSGTPDSRRTDKPQDQVRTRTVKLRDGGTAKVNWILGTPRADLFDRKGKPQGALERPGAAKTLTSGLKVTLTPGGNITQTWTKTRGTENTQRKLTLRDGSVALVEKGTDNIWGATLWSGSHGGHLDGVHATKRPTVTLPSGLKVTISKAGTLTQTFKGKTTTAMPATTTAPADTAA